MIIAGFKRDSLNSILLGRAKSEKLDKRVGYCDVALNNASIESHDSWDKNKPNRPYLNLRGNCVGVSADFPYGVTKVTLDRKSTVPFSINYELTDEQIADLTLKGLFNRGFECPSILTSNSVISIPVMFGGSVIAPENEGDLPIIFVDIRDTLSITTDKDDCGYDFAKYFEKTKLEPEKEISNDYFLDYDDIEFEDVIEEPKEFKSLDEKSIEEEVKLETEEEKELNERLVLIEKEVEKEYIEPKNKKLGIEKNEKQENKDSKEVVFVDVEEHKEPEKEENEPIRKDLPDKLVSLVDDINSKEDDEEFDM